MSADGQFVTYDPDGAIYLFDRQTGATKTIDSPGGGFTYGSPTVSSDGHFIVYQGSDGRSPGFSSTTTTLPIRRTTGRSPG